MIWFIVALALGGIWALVFWIRNRFVQPWLALEKIVDDVRNTRQPNTYLIEGNKEARRVALALEDVFQRQRALAEKVGESEFNVSTILDAMEDGLVVVDQNARIRLANPAFRRLFDLSNIGTNATLIETLRDPSVEELVQSTLATGQPRSHLISGAGGARTTAGHIAVNAVAMRDAGGMEKGVVVLFRDVTAVKHSEAVRRDFVANVSHELRTPLSIFRGYLETLRDEPDLPAEELQRILEVMERHSQRLQSLVEDLLSLAQLEEIESNLDFVDIDLRPFLDQIAKDWTKRFAAKNLAVELQVAPGLQAVRADRIRLEEIVYNLLDNSVKYSAPRDVVRISAAQFDHHFAQLSVADRGAGIPAEDLPRIFERFYRVDKARSREVGGTGLGLSIVKHIAQLHGGRVAARSVLGEGTTVDVFLPFAPPGIGSAD
ncbi:MAG: PAS domain-containing protein [Chthoniobacterales bacterium]|nr:PAS domain-containing protein [Chthoniobacterales bacterium]